MAKVTTGALDRLPHAVLLTDAGVLRVLGRLGKLETLRFLGCPVYITDLVVETLLLDSTSLGDKLSYDFMQREIDLEGGLIRQIMTGVPKQADALRSFRVNPEEQTLRLSLASYYDRYPQENRLLAVVSEAISRKTFYSPTNASLISTREFIQELAQQKMLPCRKAVQNSLDQFLCWDPANQGRNET